MAVRRGQPGRTLPMSVAYYYVCNGQRLGPVSEEQLRGTAAKEQLRPEDLVWHAGLPSWIPAAKVSGLFPPVKSTATTPQPPSSAPPRAIPAAAPVAALVPAGAGKDRRAITPAVPASSTAPHAVPVAALAV